MDGLLRYGQDGQQLADGDPWVTPDEVEDPVVRSSQPLPRWSGTIAQETLQYGPSEGDPSLRAVVSDQLCRLGIEAPAERVMILSGSQQGIDLVAKLFIDPGTP